MNIQNLIKNIRKERGLTQEEMATLVGKKQTDISKYENGKVIPPGNVLWAIQNLGKSSEA